MNAPTSDYICFDARSPRFQVAIVTQHAQFKQPDTVRIWGCDQAPVLHDLHLQDGGRRSQVDKIDLPEQRGGHPLTHAKHFVLRQGASSENGQIDIAARPLGSSRVATK